MIDRQRGKIFFECDTCGEVLESGTGDFSSAWDFAKEDGWRARKNGDVWTHACPDCRTVP